MTSEERLKSHYESLARATRFVSAADTKAAPVLALHIAHVGTLATRFEKLWPDIAGPSSETDIIVLLALIVLYVLVAAAGVTWGALVYMPTNPATGRSLIYFEDISKMNYEAFQAQAMKMTLDVIERQLLDQIYRVSEIASSKMHRVRRAFILTAPSSILWLLLLAWGST